MGSRRREDRQQGRDKSPLTSTIGQQRVGTPTWPQRYKECASNALPYRADSRNGGCPKKRVVASGTKKSAAPQEAGEGKGEGDPRKKVVPVSMKKSAQTPHLRASNTQQCLGHDMDMPGRHDKEHGRHNLEGIAETQRKGTVSASPGPPTRKPESPGWGADMKPRWQPPLSVPTTKHVFKAGEESKTNPVDTAEEKMAAEAWHRRADVLAGTSKPPAPWTTATGGAKITWSEENWDRFIKGEWKGLMAPRGFTLQHPAAALLCEYAVRGCPADCGREWTKEEIEAAVMKGPHPSTYNEGAVEQLRAETKEKVAQGFARIVKWNDIRASPPKKLKVSPVAMIPHKSRQYRCILDLSYALRIAEKQVPSVNDATSPQSIREAMNELGTTVHRIIDAIALANPQEGDIYFQKLDIKDGFWRMVVEDEEAWNFAYVLPGGDPDDIKLVVPSALQMGWTESPPFFCTATETARDVAQALVNDGVELPPHPLEEHTMPRSADANPQE